MLKVLDLGEKPTKARVVRYIYYVVLGGLRNHKNHEQVADWLSIANELKAANLKKIDFTQSTLQEIGELNFGFWNISNPKILDDYGDKIIGRNALDYKNETLCLGKAGVYIENFEPTSKNNFFGLCLFLYFQTGDAYYHRAWDFWYEYLKDHESAIGKYPEPYLEKLKEELAEQINMTKGRDGSTIDGDYLLELEEVQKRPKTIREFYTTYSGFYNIFFIEEGSSIANPKFGVSNLIFKDKKGLLFYQLLEYKSLILSNFEPIQDSTKTTFYVQEKDREWGFMASFKRPTYKESQDFMFPYLGVRQFSDVPFAGIAYAMKVYTIKDLLLPDRMQNALNADTLRLGGKPQKVIKKCQKLNLRQPASVTYDHLFGLAESISQEMNKKLPFIVDQLLSVGHPQEENQQFLKNSF